VVVPLGHDRAAVVPRLGANTKGIEPVFVLKNWREVFTDSYYLEMFGRTFRIALLGRCSPRCSARPRAYISIA